MRFSLLSSRRPGVKERRTKTFFAILRRHSSASPFKDYRRALAKGQINDIQRKHVRSLGGGFQHPSLSDSLSVASSPASTVPWAWPCGRRLFWTDSKISNNGKESSAGGGAEDRRYSHNFATDEGERERMLVKFKEEGSDRLRRTFDEFIVGHGELKVDDVHM